MSTLDTFYGRLPVGFQNLACTLVGWQMRRDRYSSDFRRALRDAEERGAWRQEDLERYRDIRLRTFVERASQTPFYRERLEKAQIAPGDIRCLADLRALPTLTKAEAKANQASLTSNNLPKRALRSDHTSGTTGTGFTFQTTVQAVHEQWAVWWRYRRWHGLGLDDWCAHFGGRNVVPVHWQEPPFWRYNWAGRQILFSAYHMNRRNLAAYVDELRRRRPPWLHGYPSLLSLVASYMIDMKCDLGYAPRWITTGAEMLLAQQATVIQKAFEVRPRQHYGMAETVANFSECELGRLHVDEDLAAVEFVPTEKPGHCSVVGTNLSNAATPLIRYLTNDHVDLDSSGCPCGRPGRVVSAVDGRFEDYIVLPDGTRIGRLDHVFKDAVRVNEAQLFQERNDEIVIRIVQADGYTKKDEQFLLAQMMDRVGTEVRLRIDYVNRIERSRIGKLQFVISSLPEGQITSI
jgi:phenylacetate-CoA ligase